MMGDFNEVRLQSDRFGSVFHARDTEDHWLKDDKFQHEEQSKWAKIGFMRIRLSCNSKKLWNCLGLNAADVVGYGYLLVHIRIPKSERNWSQGRRPWKRLLGEVTMVLFESFFACIASKSDHVNNGDAMFLGFSVSTEGSTETHFVENWSFTSFGIRHVKPRIINLHNVLDNTVTKNPDIEVPTDIRNHDKSHKKVGSVVGVLGPVFFCAILIVFGYVSVKKLKEGKTEINMQAELFNGSEIV
nr:probable L-type lectin-domain containing receptor kinase S.7 [Tanacetum cinerariifolium]